MNKTAIVCFAKDPSSENSKTRLASTIGGRLAQEFAKMAFHALEQLLLQINNESGVGVVMAVNEPTLVRPEFIFQSQGEGSFDQRLEYVYQSVSRDYENVILIGTDSPQMSRTDLISAIRILNEESHVMGPTFDGGFYLFGTSKKLDQGFWVDLPVGTDLMMEATAAKLQDSCQRLPAKVDVDYESDLIMLYSELSDLNVLLPKQRELLDWLMDSGALAAFAADSV